MRQLVKLAKSSLSASCVFWLGSPAKPQSKVEIVHSTSRPARAVIRPSATRRSRMNDPILGQLAALKTAPVGVLKAKWRDLFDREPPPYNRRFLESRLAYRIQELAYGGLSKETIERLEAIADELEGKRRH